MQSKLGVALTAVGIIWLYGMKILEWIGRMLDVIQLGDFVTSFQEWLVNHPDLANEYGPWALIGGGLVSLVVTHAAPPIYRAWKQEDLEIVYDPVDEKGQFGGVGLWHKYQTDEEPINAYIFRIGVKNNTRKTIYDVTGTVEGDLVERGYPVALRFSRTRELESNLDPKRMLLMDIFALTPPDPNDWPDGTHTIIARVNGRDTSEAMRRFCFDKSRMPALYVES